MTFWDQKFSGSTYLYGTEPNDYLKQTAHHIPKGRVLCLADGEGRNSVYLAEQGYDVTAVDNSQVGLEKAVALAKSRGVTITPIFADLVDFDLGINHWDGVVSIFCHLPPLLRTKVHTSVAPALRSGGVLILEAYSPKQLDFGTGGPRDLDLLMTTGQIEQDFKNLSIDQLSDITREIIEGHGHTGQGAVVQCRAHKN